ncbi:glycosyltransferase family 2 protein [Actinomadura madurae]|uniref:glycosyltransferase family 2 protein n=1 Tax=Actinomadura madurae TaxID=1993 RepID=UPI0020D20081|nr:glycosyltransferase [Actinomadura madurae]
MPPSVGVVLPTHNRPELLRRALESVLAQDYDGELRAVVVFDRAEPDASLAGDRVEVIANTREPGLAARPATPASSTWTPTSWRSATTTTSGCPASSPRR